MNDPCPTNLPEKLCSDSQVDLILDNTKRSTFDSCPRKFYWEHMRGLKPIMGSTALRFGTTWHGFLEGFYKHIQEHGWVDDNGALAAACKLGKSEWEKESATQEFYDDYRTLETCAETFLDYLEFYNLDKAHLEVVATEQVFRHVFTLTDDEKRLFPELAVLILAFTGKIDLQVLLNGSPWIMEHKSTGQQVSMQAQRLNRSAQIQGYFDVSRKELNFEPEGVLTSFASVSARKSTAKNAPTGTYGKVKRDFHRAPQIFSDGDLLEWRKSFLATANNVALELKRGLWPKCQDNCFAYGECKFAPLCDQNLPLEETRTHGFIYQPWNVEKS